MKQIVVKIAENKKVAPEFCRMRVESPYLAKNTMAGQFYDVRVSTSTEILLRRPLGAHRILKNGVEMLYQIKGKGTEALSRKKPGEMLDVLGPLGHGFEIKRTTNDEQRTTILIAGGIGVAPMVALAESMVRRFAGSPVRRLKVLIGACKKDHILCEADFKRIGAEVHIATEDGSKGHKGLITDVLISYLNRQTGKPANRQTTIYACGPHAMLKEVARLAEAHKAECQVSLDERMACGVGVCLGCPVKVRRLASSPVSQLKPVNRQTGKPANYTYKMVCKDGPVFNAEEIVW
jgi:dihydroorotate dehydrogenase electron transfer subunit